MITVNNIHFSMGQLKLLDDVSFDVQPGELLAIIGANGAGKSTLLRLLCREIGASEGEISIRERPINSYTLSALAKFRAVLAQSNRSEERRVGKEWVSTCRIWGTPIHKNKKDLP